MTHKTISQRFAQSAPLFPAIPTSQYQRPKNYVLDSFVIEKVAKCIERAFAEIEKE